MSDDRERGWCDANGVPNPGTRAAKVQGCRCPVMDNWRGSPEIGRIRGFIVVQGCPLHAMTDATPGSRASACSCGWSGVPTNGCCPLCRASVGDGEAATLSEARR